MTKGVKKINIGVIDSKNDTLGIAKKTRSILEKAIKEAQSTENTIPLSDTLLKSTSQFFGVILDTANQVMKTEEVEKNLTEKLKTSGYTVDQIEGILKAVRNQIEKLAVHSSKTIKFTADDIKKIIALGTSMQK